MRFVLDSQHLAFSGSVAQPGFWTILKLPSTVCHLQSLIMCTNHRKIPPYNATRMTSTPIPKASFTHEMSVSINTLLS